MTKYYELLARYYILNELKKEAKDFALLSIKQVVYQGLKDKHTFSVLVETDSLVANNKVVLDEELLEIFKVMEEDLKDLTEKDLELLSLKDLEKIQNSFIIVDVVKKYKLYGKNYLIAELKEDFKEVENKISNNLDGNDIKKPLFLSYISLKAGYGIKAEETLKRAAQVYPENFIIRNRYAVLLKEMGKFDEAVEDFLKQIEIFNKAITWYYLGMTYKNKENCEEAVKYLTEFISLSKEDSDSKKVVARNAITECEEGFKKNKKREKKIRRKK